MMLMEAAFSNAFHVAKRRVVFNVVHACHTKTCWRTLLVLLHVAQIPYIGMFKKNNTPYIIRAKRVKNLKTFFRKKAREGGHILRLPHVFGCYKMALLFEIMLDYITIFCIEVLRIH